MISRLWYSVYGFTRAQLELKLSHGVPNKISMLFSRIPISNWNVAAFVTNYFVSIDLWPNICPLKPLGQTGELLSGV